MARLLGVLATLALGVALTVTSTTASASAPSPPRNCGPPVVGTPTNSSATPLADNAVTTSTLAVSGLAATVGDVDVITNVTHTGASDIDMTVTSPAGTVVTLTTDNGGSLDNVFAGTRWDDDAAPGGVPTETNTPIDGNVQTNQYLNGVAASPLAPEEALGAFIGENPNDTWTLTVSDDSPGDAGTLNSWALNIQSLTATPPPATTSIYTESPATPISAGAPSVVTSQIQAFAEPPYLGDVEVMTNISHTAVSDLQVALTSPAGTTVFLSTGIFAPSGAVSAADNVFAGTLWKDDANPAGQLPYATNPGLASDHPYADMTLATPLAPSEGLAAFRGENANGIWTLTAADQFSGDGGTLNSWSLRLTPAACTVPDTAIDSGPAEGSTVGSADATFTFSSVPAGNATGFECSLDGGAFTACTSARQVTGLANGQHRFEVAALGDGGDRDFTPATRTWTVNVPASGPDPPGGEPGAKCVVPQIAKGASSRVVADKLEAAGCALGDVSRKFNRKVKRGKLIKLKTSAGTQLPVGTEVDAVFSKGKRKR